MNNKIIYFLVSFLLLNNLKIYCVSYTNFNGFSVKDKARKIRIGEVNIDQLGADQIIDESNIDNSLSLLLQIPPLLEGAPLFYDGSFDKLLKQELVKEIKEFNKIKKNKLKIELKSKLDQYKVDKKIPTYVDYIAEYQPPLRNYSQSNIVIDDFSYEIEKNKKYGNNIFVFTQQEKYGLDVTKTPNCTIKTYKVDDSTLFSVDHHTLCYQPKIKEEGKVDYTFSKSINFLTEFSNPILQLRFSNISQPFNLVTSVTNKSENTYFSYPVLHCTPNKLIYDTDLLAPKSPINVTSLEGFSFNFQVETEGPQPCFCLIVPEPFSLVTIGFGTGSFIKSKRMSNI